MTPKMKLLAIGGGALALVLVASVASADSTPVPGPGPNPNPNPGRKVRPNPFPNGAGEASVNANGQGGMMTRKGPGTNHALIAPEGRSPNDAFSGTNVAVLQTGVAPTDGQGGEWWKIMTPGGGVGFARAVDSKGVRNFTLISPIQAGFDPNMFAAIAGARYVAANQMIRRA